MWLDQNAWNNSLDQFMGLVPHHKFTIVGPDL